jgi:hypothetical protein
VDAVDAVLVVYDVSDSAVGALGARDQVIPENRITKASLQGIVFYGLKAFERETMGLFIPRSLRTQRKAFYWQAVKRARSFAHNRAA